MAKKRSQCRSKSCVRSRKRRIRVDNKEVLPDDNRQNNSRVSVFEDYLYVQNWLFEKEFYRFLSTLRRPLPVCFRIRDNFEDYGFQQLLHEERAHDQARQMPGGAWQLPSSALQAYPRIRQWLSTQTAQGHISRQEFVSMIPVLLLDIQSHHTVLDLCASPGSKTIQAVDALYANTTTSEQQPTGFVMANELDPRRAYVLAHRCQATLGERMKSLAVVNHNATKFPNVLAPLRRISSSPKERPFDRIICDVPCSGDGTLRKDTKVWRTWHPSYGIQLHALQVRIAKRGIALLRMGGMMTYSTCSFHPIENEAVVAALLETGCVEVVACDCVRSLKGIRRRQGLTEWKVLDDDCHQVASHSDRPDWPSTLWANRKHHRSLQRCIRMVPHDNDSGGFFIALLRKIQEFPAIGGSDAKTEASAPVAGMVTPQAEHHKLFPVKDHNEKDAKVFTRGPTGKRQFQIANSLAHCLTNTPGSDKINLVYAGHNDEKMVAP
ncbi:Multisite-specific tRNA:(cytosine-C(5))-methyltransferase trm4b [Seminavis robusta]|uniref:Multisite-specific tRNA:(Cytosine-C(5))-methyltransferase trm4b n=1 Tax=Seminavis robusta TaxID=568900 RepID=A0A9N8E012_9STRA|nr:Multisite-specific tRNA:(cytosine-C(5))-methyltransferase trm4b [Seminavis robusta]|eukprot:Sro514_g158160.1 Multisite-specific tRNA:(cytosine-C(5))-methyltransferase trm4b (493) ;mRNA; r:53482-55273